MQALLERPTVLVVDDERGPRESLRMILEPAHRVLLAVNGSEALEILRTTSVDVVSLDLNMPGMKGSELMSTLRSEFPQVEVVVITGYGTVESATLAVRYGISDYLQKPFDVVQVTAAVGRALERRRGQRELVTFLEALGSVLGRERDVRALLAEIARSPRLRGSVGEVMDHAGRRARAQEGESARTSAFLEVLAETIESQDRYMRGHARRVAFYAGLLAERICLSAKEQEHVRISAFLHDLGKIGIPTELLQRPGALEPAERGIVERHSEIGARLVEPLGIASGIAGAIRHHHEWWDGSGYPDGLHGDDIPLAARIVHLANAFDAMTCDRPYRRALPREVVARELQRFAGVQFDPGLAKEFIALVESGALEVDLEVVAEAVAGVGGWKESAGSSAQS
ncbi:MAG TPA: HD domain-containing phosphohydrolase [Myxococcota bacterium]|nr:HD domain-containing phosphohydrolase [Myxococcota bacterium]